MTERELFLQAIEIDDPAARAAFLQQACATRPGLRDAVEQLLQAHHQAGDFLARRPRAAHDAAPTLAPATVPGPVEAPGLLIADKYKLLQQIGEGGMGSVWMADQLAPVKRRVAVKLIRGDRGSSRSILSRFEAERQAVALMDHPNIAKLLDAGTTAEGSAGRPYFVMELVKGIPLTEFCDQRQLSIPERLELFVQICGAVQHAHQKGVIHRDLKPTNILVELHEDKPTPKVIDFGLAKAMSGQPLTDNTLFTGFGTVLGTPLYMAPEQARVDAVDIDTRADIYALGAILYELLTGSTPIERQQLREAAASEVLRVICESQPLTPSKRLSSSASIPSVAANRRTEPVKLGRFVRGELDWVVMKALSKERDRRYESATAFARDVERFLNHEPVQAGPPSTTYLVRKFVQRHRGQVVAASLVLLALLAGVAGTTVGLIRARKAEGTALGEARRARDERDAKERALDQEQQAKLQESQARREALAEAERANHLVNTNSLLLSQAAWDDGEPRQAVAQLHSIAEPDRGWVWTYLRRRFQGGLFTLYGHAAIIPHAMYSPDGSRIVTASNDHTARIWDARSGRQLHTLEGHTDIVLQVAISPDSHTLATLSLDKTLRLWELQSGRALQQIPVRVWGADPLVEFNRQGDRLAWSLGSSTSVAATAQGNELYSVPGAFRGFGPDGQRFLTATQDPAPAVKVWNAEDGSPFGQLDVAARDARISPDGTRIATLTERFEDRVDLATNFKSERLVSEFALWDAATYQRLASTPQSPERVTEFAFSPDGTQILTVHPETVRLWNTADGRLIFNSAINERSRTYANQRTVAFRPDGRYVAVAVRNGVRVWDTATGKESAPVRELAELTNACYAPDGRHLLTFGGKSATVWDAEYPHAILHAGQSSLSRGIAFSPDGRMIAFGRSLARLVTDPASGNRRIQTADTSIVVWDTTTGQMVVELRPAMATFGCTFSPDGRWLAAVEGGLGEGTTIWDTRTWQVARTFPHGRFDPAWSSDGRLLAVQNPQFGILILNAESGEIVQSCLGHSQRIFRPAFSPDGTRLLTVSLDKTARLWDVATGEQLRTFEPPVAELLLTCDFSPDGRYVAAGGERWVTVWETDSGRQIRALRVENSQFGSNVRTVRFTPDGKSLLTLSTGERTSPQIWDLRTGQRLAQIELPKVSDNNWYHTCLAESGTKAAFAAGDGTLVVVDLADAYRELPIPGQIEYAAGDEPSLVRGRFVDRRIAVNLGMVDGNRRLAASPDGDHFALALDDHTVQVRSSRTGQETARLRGHTGTVLAVAYSPDGSLVATYAEDRTARIWDAHDGTVRHTIDAHTAEITDMSFAPDGQRLVTVSNDRSARIWDVRSGQQVFQAVDDKVAFTNVAFSADGRHLATQAGPTTTVWDTVTQIPVTDVQFRDWNPPSIAPAGRYFPWRIPMAGRSPVVLIDREIGADELARRGGRTGPDVAWHLAELGQARQTTNTLAEQFHREFLLLGSTVDTVLASPNQWLGDVWYEWARLHAAAMGQTAEEQAERTQRAVSLLQAAITFGWTSPDRIDQDPEWAALRDREDIRRLIQSLRKPG